jgi:hypothetical protein
MAISTNMLLKDVRGAINKQVVVRQFPTMTVLSGYPQRSGHKPTPKQERRQKIMQLANEEVADIKADKERRDAAQLRLNVPSNKLHHALLSECMRRLDKEVE